MNHGAASAKARINGISLAYTDQGEGLPVLFIHAFPLSKAMWRPQVAALSPRFRVITVDLRGHGESDAPLWHYTLEQFADDLDALLVHLNIDQAVFVGLSMGGYTLFSFYRKYRARVKGLVLADTRAQADSEEGRNGRFQLAQTAARQGPAAVADAMLPKLLTETSRTSRPDLVRTVRGMITANEVSGIAGDLMAMAERPDSIPLLKEISCPTLVVVGDADAATPPSDARIMAERIAGARLVVIPGAGHLANLEHPQAFNQALVEFLDECLGR